MVNFDNAATTFPKPDQVRQAVNTALLKFGGNPGRSGHGLSIATAKAVYEAREVCALFFGGAAENTAFTLNCTHALNTAINGIMAGGGHIITSALEHNSVIRPIHAMVESGRCEASTLMVYPKERDTMRALEGLIRYDTRAVVCTAASNVTGQILPYGAIGNFCHEKGICFILDAAQGAGVLPINMGKDRINFLCTAGHKGLYGPAGTGLLITDGTYSIPPLMRGGTGTLSLELDQPSEWPDAMESGTVNTCGAIGLGAGVEFVRNMGINRIHSHETALCRQFIEGLKRLRGVVIYRSPEGDYAPIVAFNLEGYTPNELTAVLSERGFCLRGGIHCAAFAHRVLGTAPDGTVRFSPSVFNNTQQVSKLLRILYEV